MLHKICVRQVFTSIRINHLSVWQLSGCCRCFIGDKAVSRKLLPCHLLRVPADNYSSFTVQTDQQKLYCQKLKHRSLIKILGTDSYKFLQGLVTNDINLLVNAPAIYAMMLNVQGRVMYDLILYRAEDASSVIVECESKYRLDVMGAFSKYKLRNKVKLVDLNDDFDVWTVFDESDGTTAVIPNCSQQAIFSPDPRLISLGSRLLLPRGLAATAVISGCKSSEDDVYRQRLCRVGIGEGAVDFPPGQCLPLECNLAFLNGVNFHKGCYIGQELTARTHHTGVIRKRLMPLILSQTDHLVKPDATVINSSGRVCGKVRSVSGNHALGLLRVAEVIGSKGPLTVKMDETVIAEATTHIPSWWPLKADIIVQQSLSKEQD